LETASYGTPLLVGTAKTKMPILGSYTCFEHEKKTGIVRILDIFQD